MRTVPECNVAVNVNIFQQTAQSQILLSAIWRFYCCTNYWMHKNDYGNSLW